MDQPQRLRTEACGKGLILPCADTNWIKVLVYLSHSPSAGLCAPLSTAFLATVKANGMISVPISVAWPHLQIGVPSVLLCRTPSPGLFHPDWIYVALGHKGSLLSLAHPLGFCLKWESGGWELVFFLWLLCRCLLFKWEVSSCAHT